MASSDERMQNPMLASWDQPHRGPVGFHFFRNQITDKFPIVALIFASHHP